MTRHGVMLLFSRSKGDVQGADLAILANQLPLLGLQHVVVGNELRLQGCKRLTCLPSVLTMHAHT